MLKNNLIQILFYFFMAAAIFWLGRFSITSSKSHIVDEHGVKKEADEHAGHDDHASHAEEPTKLSPEMIANIGVKVSEIEKKTYVKYLEVPAIIKANANKATLITSFSSGTIKKLNVTKGESVKKGKILGLLMRDALPYPNFEEIKDYYQNNNVEMLLMGLNQTRDENLELIGSYTDSIGLDKAMAINLKKLTMVEQREAIFLLITEKAGLWKNDLKLFHQKLAALPGAKIPEMIPALVLINRQGVLDDNKKEAILKYCRNQKETMAMLYLIKENFSLEYLIQFGASGYLSEEVELKAPEDGVIEDVFIKNGQLINNREVLFNIIDTSSLTAVAKLRGIEASIFKGVISKSEKLNIKNLQNEGLLPAEFLGMQLENVSELTAQFNIVNKPLSSSNNMVWQYMPGDQCILMIPEKQFDTALVLPRTAVVEEGFKRFVFMESGNTFEKVEVSTLFMDKQMVVLGAETSLFEGDRVVFSGAYELNIAMKEPVKLTGHEGHSH